MPWTSNCKVKLFFQFSSDPNHQEQIFRSIFQSPIRDCSWSNLFVQEQTRIGGENFSSRTRAVEERLKSNYTDSHAKQISSGSDQWAGKVWSLLRKQYWTNTLDGPNVLKERLQRRAVQTFISRHSLSWVNGSGFISISWSIMQKKTSASNTITVFIAVEEQRFYGTVFGK